VTRAGGAMAFVGNEIDSNLKDGVSLSSSANVLLEQNNVHDNGSSGINITGASRDISVRNGTISRNAANGVIVQGGAGYVLVEGNRVSANTKIGIDLVASDHNTLRNNVLALNPTGILLTGGSGSNTIEGNDLATSSSVALSVLGGAAHAAGFGNLIVNNTIHDNAGYALKVQDQDNTVVEGNTFTGNVKSPAISVATSRNTHFLTNVYSIDVIIKTTGRNNLASQTIISGETQVKVQVDAFSSIVAKDIAGTIYKIGSFNLATTSTPTYTLLTLTSANIATSPQILTARRLSAYVDFGSAQVLTNETTWDTTGLGSKSWTTTADSTGQTAFYVVGDCVAGATYNIFKNGVLLASQVADTEGNLAFSDVAGTLAKVTFLVTHA